MRQDERSPGLRSGYATLVVFIKALCEISCHANISFSIGKASENVDEVGHRE
jgi:hypothetical protein